MNESKAGDKTNNMKESGTADLAKEYERVQDWSFDKLNLTKISMQLTRRKLQ
jgi:hypothetical protein